MGELALIILGEFNCSDWTLAKMVMHFVNRQVESKKKPNLENGPRLRYPRLQIVPEDLKQLWKDMPELLAYAS
jgi:hypothetical protein